MLDHRYVYLMEIVDARRDHRARRVKIGIARNVPRRLRQVNAGLRGHVVLVGKYRLLFSRRTETYLHRRYERYRTPVANIRPGAGGSEIFTLTPLKLAYLRLILGAFVATDVFITFTLVAAAAKIIYALCYFLY